MIFGSLFDWTWWKFLFIGEIVHANRFVLVLPWRQAIVFLQDKQTRIIIIISPNHNNILIYFSDHIFYFCLREMLERQWSRDLCSFVEPLICLGILRLLIITVIVLHCLAKQKEYITHKTIYLHLSLLISCFIINQ